MENLKVDFDILTDGKYHLFQYNKANRNLIFDARMKLERKSRRIKDGHKTHQPEQSTFAGVVSHKRIIIDLTYTALNKLTVFGYDIQNDYLQDPLSEKHYIICGPKFGLENEEKIAIIFRDFYMKGSLLR